MQMSEKYLAEQREKDINHRMIQGDKIDQDKVLGIGSVMFVKNTGNEQLC